MSPPLPTSTAACITAATDDKHYEPRTVIDIQKQFKAFPSAARERLIHQEATTFTGNAIHLFAHHVTPILNTKRAAVLASGKTKKKFPKTAKQLWSDVEGEEKEFWEHEAWRLREAMKKGDLTAEQVLTDAGERERWMMYAAFAEVAVAGYLRMEVEGWVWKVLRGEEEDNGFVEEVDVPWKEDALATAALNKDEELISELTLREDDRLNRAKNQDNPETIIFTTTSGPLEKPFDLAAEKATLLDTLPPPLPLTPKIIYGNFAQLYPYTSIHQAIGWKQISLLRQLADLLDPSGREFFYYHAVPHLWLVRPSPVGKTIASEAHEIWQFMRGKMKEEWRVESARVKKLLGDGKVEGLEGLQIHGLREMVESAIVEEKERKGKVNGM